MKPAAFSYFAPRDLDEALHLLAHHAPDAKPLAGGQSLVPMMNFRLAQPRVLIDLNRVAALSFVNDANGVLVLGAMLRQAAAERDHRLSAAVPLLADALPLVGHETIRHRGTIGGTLAHADPAAEIPAVALALGAELVVRSTRGERVISADQFFLGPLMTALEPDEMLIAVRIPRMPPHTGTAFLELSRRHGDFAIVGVAAQVTLDESERIVQAALALCGVGPTPVRARQAEAALAGAEPTDEQFRAAGALAAQEIDPASDIHASADYRRRIAAVLVRRALSQAAQRAQGRS
ncbi:FAD binding domain-containing protein [Thermorudis peleae]|uniref:FAD binding domain-containing protein n=1 Tax=Thermorudis peleae TaxID=1382356 RepID=UPI0005709402|nr:xanthine dehydrogenase family protein subunit M [Thermorudis peleae]